MDRYCILLGGGEIRAKETLEIDRVIASYAKAHADSVLPGSRPNALFLGTASHDFMPYYNTFHKTYTGELGLKTDVFLSVFQQTPAEKADLKFSKADMIYVGGGDTLFMLDTWAQSDTLSRIRDAYARGVVLAGLSAGAICWFDRMFTDSARNGSDAYHVEQGLGLLPGNCCPHYDLRRSDFLSALSSRPLGESWLCIENNAALLFKNDLLVSSLSSLSSSSSSSSSSSGRAFRVSRTENGIVEEVI